MASRKPIVRQTAWLSLIPQILFIGALYIIYSFFIESKLFSIYLTLLTYLFLSITLRSSLSRYHRKGMTLVKKEKYDYEHNIGKSVSEILKSKLFSLYPITVL